MTNVLNYLKAQKIDLAKVCPIYLCTSLRITENYCLKLIQTYSIEKVKEMLGDIIKSCHEKAKEQQQADSGYIKLERGFATIPLPGIDVPFHSRYLWAGVHAGC